MYTFHIQIIEIHSAFDKDGDKFRLRIPFRFKPFDPSPVESLEFKEIESGLMSAHTLVHFNMSCVADLYIRNIVQDIIYYKYLASKTSSTYLSSVPINQS